MDFIHLCVHSHYTILGATASPAGLAGRAAAEGMGQLALTDTNALYGAVAFSRACLAKDVQPILGMVVTVAPPAEAAILAGEGPGHLVLLATGPAGYRSLSRLSSAIQGTAQRLQVAQSGVGWELLAEHREGLLALSGGRLGWAERLVRAGDAGAGARYLSRLAGIYDDNAFVALELHGNGDHRIAAEMSRLADRFGLAPVAVQPIYCLDVEERQRLRLLAAIDCNCRFDAVPRRALPDRGEDDIDLHWLTAAEVHDRFAAFPAAVTATVSIGARCQSALPDGRPIWPVLKLPEGETVTSALEHLASQGLASRYGEVAPVAVRQRLQSELQVISGHGFAPLFLLVADVVRFARAEDIPVSTRGSVANSLVAYCCGITTVDPVRHDLLFERFLSPARSQPPDIDLDFCSRRRDEVLDYVRRTHGEQRVALVSTVSTLRPRSALRETGKAHGLDEATVARLVRLLPDRWHPDPRRRTSTTVEDALAQLHDPLERRVVTDAYALLDQPHHLSVHPGGMVVAPGFITDYAPVQWTAKGFLITQFDHSDVEAIGLPKLDLLGIRALTVLADATDLVRKHHDAGFRIANIALDDAATGSMLQCGDTIGVFQCESWGARRTLRELKAKDVADLAVANAFFKPGPATGGMARAFIRRYRGEETVTYLHPYLEPILARTKGVLLFQEQILRLAVEIAGLSWEEADHLRRGMSKFQPHEMAAMRSAFLAGCQRPGGPDFTPQQAETLWEQVQAFAGYGFNQGHATAYADVSYRSAYLKAHFPGAFLCARLQDWGGFHHPAIYIAEALRLGMDVRPPHVNHSRRSFTLAWEGMADEAARPVLWMGLGQVRDLRRRSVRAVLGARRQGPFAGLRDLLQRVPLQPKEITHLIQCGALDGLGPHRAGLLAEADAIARSGSALQLAFDFAQPPASPDSIPERLEWERRLLGQPVSVHPLDALPSHPPGLTPMVDLVTVPGRRVRVAAARLPGWTGGKGYFIGDRRTFVVAIPDPGLPVPRAWQPVLLEGRWLVDEWGMGWLQVAEANLL